MTVRLRRSQNEIAEFYAKRIAEVESGEDEFFRLPAFLMYAQDFLTGDAVASFDGEQVGWFVNLLCICWNSRPQGTLPAHRPELLKQRAKYFQDIQVRLNGLRNGVRIGVPSETVTEILDLMTQELVVEGMRYEERWDEVMAEFEPVPGFPNLLHNTRLTSEAMKSYESKVSRLRASVYANRVKSEKIKVLRPNRSPNRTSMGDRLTTELEPNGSPNGRPNRQPFDDRSIKYKDKEEKDTNVSKKFDESAASFDPIQHFPREDKPNKKGTRINLDWQPDKALEDFCLLETGDLDCETERRKFIDYWIAVPGKAGLKLDWQATFRNHLRRQQQFIDDRKQSPLGAAERLLKRDAEEDKRNEPKPEPEHHPLFDDE